MYIRLYLYGYISAVIVYFLFTGALLHPFTFILQYFTFKFIYISNPDIFVYSFLSKYLMYTATRSLKYFLLEGVN